MNREHLRLLSRGAAHWNAWRRENPDVVPDLEKARVVADEGELLGVNLAGARMRRAIMRRQDLRQAELRGADLVMSDLRGIRLSGADLRLADLRGARLQGARLDDADLSRASLLGTRLYEASLAGALLSETLFADTDLSATAGLEQCRHRGPSTVDHRTLARSGSLPRDFLRGCGLPEALIEQLPEIMDDPSPYHSCFISYSSQDTAFASRIYDDLQDRGVRCWYAPEDLKIGERIRTRVDEVIRRHDKVLLILSEHSVASDWVEKEVETAFERERERRGESVLFPIRIDDAVMSCKTGWSADIKRSRHIGDFTAWTSEASYRASFDRLLRDLTIATG